VVLVIRHAKRMPDYIVICWLSGYTIFFHVIYGRTDGHDESNSRFSLFCQRVEKTNRITEHLENWTSTSAIHSTTQWIKAHTMCIFVLSDPHIENVSTYWPPLSWCLPTFLFVDRNTPIFWKPVFRFALFINTGKVNFSLEQATKAQMGSGGTAVLFL
jgi:hypothetical protein